MLPSPSVMIPKAVLIYSRMFGKNNRELVERQTRSFVTNHWSRTECARSPCTCPAPCLLLRAFSAFNSRIAIHTQQVHTYIQIMRVSLYHVRYVTPPCVCTSSRRLMLVRLQVLCICMPLSLLCPYFGVWVIFHFNPIQFRWKPLGAAGKKKIFFEHTFEVRAVRQRGPATARWKQTTKGLLSVWMDEKETSGSIS